MELPKRPRSAGVWLRSAEASNKKPASDKQSGPFEARMKELGMPARLFATESTVKLYNQCRAHAVLLIELESKVKRLEYERNNLQAKKAGGGAAQAPTIGITAKRTRSELGDRAAKRSHH
mmetsp:Transcript_8824/g.26092  ORF Transcript_8824/g.26092 Transcript_8824/m.26092 type:complete len:120 (-) Transcript_8824:208-567(-)